MVMVEIFDVNNLPPEPRPAANFNWQDRNDWAQRGLCYGLGGEDGERASRIFFPERGENTKEAKAICKRCPVRAECLRYGLETVQLGIWGGTTEKERRDMRRVRRGKA